MNTLLKLKKVNLKYQTDKESIKVLKDIDLTTKKKGHNFNCWGKWFR